MQRILLLTDNENDINQMAALLEQRYELAVAGNRKAAAKLAAEKRPALLLVDVILAEADGFSVCEFPERQDGMAIPVLFITERSRPEDVAKAFRLGGQDHIARPFCSDEIYARIALHLQFRQAQVDLRQYIATVEQKNLQLRDLAEQFDNAARIDLLTAIPNRWYMIERMKDEVARSFRHQRPFTVITVNIDNFTAIISDYGRDCGDFVLQSIADILRLNRRGEDVVSRWGGDVFLVMLPETTIADGGLVAERIRTRVEGADISYSGGKVPVTVTVGVAEFDNDIGIEGTVNKAKAAVTAGKLAAKNCVVLSPSCY